MICPIMNTDGSDVNDVGMELWTPCQEDDCAWWNKAHEECNITTLGEALGAIAIMKDERG